MISPKVKRLFKWMERNGELAKNQLDSFKSHKWWWEIERLMASLIDIPLKKDDSLYFLEAEFLTNKYMAEKWISKRVLEVMDKYCKERAASALLSDCAFYIHYKKSGRKYKFEFSSVEATCIIQEFKKNHPTAEILYFN